MLHIPNKSIYMAEGEYLSFGDWMNQVNAQLEAKVGVGSEDMSDCRYKDWYQERLTPIAAANRALSYNEGNDAEDGDEEFEDEEDY